MRNLVSIAMLAAVALPQQQPPVTPFDVPAKQTLHYAVEWRMVRAGTARVTWSNHGNGHQGDLHLESAGLVSKLYRVNDDYQAQLNQQLCATAVLLKAEEGKRRRETKVSFGGGKAHYLERDLIKNNVVLAKETTIVPCTFEYLGALRRLRSMKLDPGQSTEVPLTDGKKFAMVKVEAQEREQVRTQLGTFQTIRYEVFMFNNVLINRNARMHLWITDDTRRLPVQMRVRISFLIGTITLELEKEES